MLALALAVVTTSNGFAAASYDAEAGRLTSLRPHLYAQIDADRATPELAGAVYFGLRANADNRWLDDVTVDECGYDGDTGMVRVVQRHGPLLATQYWFSSFAGDLPHLVAIVEVTNTGTAELAEGAVFALHDLATGGDETVTWRGSWFEETGDDRVIHHRPLGAGALRHAIDPRAAVDAGARLSDIDSAGPRADLTVGFEWNLDGLAAGDSRVVGVVIAIDPAAGALDPLVGEPAALLERERADWRAYHERARTPPAADSDETAVYRRALAQLRMAQVREPGPGAGQLVAALAPAAEARSWVRDQAYAVRALVRAGLHAEARAALEFWLTSAVGDYANDVAADYGVSVLRYRGDGSEETDLVDGEPVIGFDGLGLALVAIAEHALASGDDSLIASYRTRVFDELASVLPQLIDIDDTNLIRADNSVWNGPRRKHTYSQLAVIAGLRAAARLAEGDQAAIYDATANVFTAALESQLVGDDGALEAATTAQPSRLDGAVVEAFNLDVLPPSGDIATATLDALAGALADGDGYRRSDQEPCRSAAVSLWVTMAARRAGRQAEADRLLAGLTRRARADADRVTDDCGGLRPIGLGAALYTLALWQRAEAAEPAGCCDARASNGSWWLIPLVWLLVAGRRRMAPGAATCARLAQAKPRFRPGL